MPLVRIDLHTPLAGLRPQISAAINSALAEGWGMPADDLFQIFQLHEEGDLFYSRTFPDADRSDIVFIDILVYSGYSAEVKQRGAALIVERLAALGIKPDDILISLHENGDGDWLAPSKPVAPSLSVAPSPAEVQ